MEDDLNSFESLLQAIVNFIFSIFELIVWLVSTVVGWGEIVVSFPVSLAIHQILFITYAILISFFLTIGNINSWRTYIQRARVIDTALQCTKSITDAIIVIGQNSSNPSEGNFGSDNFAHRDDLIVVSYDEDVYQEEYESYDGFDVENYRIFTLDEKSKIPDRQDLKIMKKVSYGYTYNYDEEVTEQQALKILQLKKEPRRLNFFEATRIDILGVLGISLFWYLVYRFMVYLSSI
ncbi:hypothetical protein N9X63_04050 [Woeseiaceae bacterium]|nr:hypothetical protein [Woeseiaceae bacterium]